MSVVLQPPKSFGWNWEIGTGTRDWTCGLGFSIKLFCGCADNQTIVQYILLEWLPSALGIV